MAKTEDYNLGQFIYPRGWFMIADAEELQNEALPLEFFGREFVLYRGETGRVVLLDAYCAHMGSHIAKNATSFVVMDGQIEGDSIRCPYHAWRYGPDGKCDDIPYHDGPIPEAACIKSWPVEEKYGCIFVWHDPERVHPTMTCPRSPNGMIRLGCVGRLIIWANSTPTLEKSLTILPTLLTWAPYMGPPWNILRVSFAGISLFSGRVVGTRRWRLVMRYWRRIPGTQVQAFSCQLSGVCMTRLY